VTYAIFSNKLGKDLQPCEGTVADLVKVLRATSSPTKELAPLLKLATFSGVRNAKGVLRYDQAVLALCGVELDYDQGVMSIEEAQARLEAARLPAVLYTTPSHSPESPRWRALVFTSEAVDPSLHTTLVSRVNGVLGGVLARESWILSQSYYFGAAHSNPNPAQVLHTVCGEGMLWLDQADDLDVISIGKPAVAVKADGTRSSGIGLFTDLIAANGGAKLKTGDNRRAAMLSYLAGESAGGRLPVQLWHLAEGAIKEYFDPDDSPDLADIKSMIDSFARKGEGVQPFDNQLPGAVGSLVPSPSGSPSGARALAGRTNPRSAAAQSAIEVVIALPFMFGSREDAQAAQAVAALGAGPFRFVDADGELHTLAPLALADEQRAAHAAQRFPLLTPAELDALPALVWRVRGVLPAQGLAALFGPSGSGKTFLALDVAAAIVEGGSWFGHRVSAAPVVYAALEGEAGLKQRAQAWRVSRGRALPENLRVMKEPFRLTELQDVEGLAASTLRALGPGSVVFIDTLNRAAPTADENASRDMGEMLEAAKRLQALTGGVVVLVHHTGKDTTRGLRGHSSLFAAMDAAVEVSREGDGDRREWRVAKSKDGADGEAHPFTLEVLTLGEDEDGDPITSCVVTPGTGGAVRAPRLTPTQRASVDSLAAAVGLHGELNEDDTLRGVHVESWREVFYSTSTADTPAAKRQAFKRARDWLRDSGRATVLDDFYQPTDAALSFHAVREIRQRLTDMAAAAGQRDSVTERDINVTCHGPEGSPSVTDVTQPYRGVTVSRSSGGVESKKPENQEASLESPA